MKGHETMSFGRIALGSLLLLASACSGTIGDGPGSSKTGGGPNPPSGTGGGPVIGPDGGILPPLMLDDGHAMMRRLNRDEYNNTMRDLLGTATRPADAFPADEISAGFDTIGQYLAFSPLHAEQMEGATGKLVDELFARAASDPVRKSILTCDLQPGAEAACASKILSGFARRAFRRPVTQPEVDSLMKLVDAARAGDTYENGVKAAMQAVLLSPNFVYRVERDPAHLTTARPANDDELATRLSYFIWSSMPDAELFASADAKRLAGDPAELARQVERMLADRKASSLVTRFGSQWLKLGRMAVPLDVDAKIFPTYDDALRISASQETLLFFDALLRNDLPLGALVTGGFTFADARLAKHYGLPSTGAFARVSLAGTPRSGILTQASVLLGTSLANRTSPVKRGVWILEQMLCESPPPPPPNIDIPPLVTPPAGATIRQALEAHRSNPMCAACHKVMDPLGFGLENFDAIGAYRTMDNGAPVDASGLYDGRSFVGAGELASLVSGDARFARCVTEQLLTYAVGRSFHDGDAVRYADAVAANALAFGKGTWLTFIETIAASEAFRTRPGEP
jgi:hypothetical protein